MKVSLVQAPVWWTIDPPLGLGQMAGCAMQFGHDVSVFDLSILLWKSRVPKYENLWLWEQFHFWNNPQVVRAFFKDNREQIERHVQDILRTDSRVVCFSVALGSQLASLELARLIKKEDPARFIVMGGQYFFKGNKAHEMLQNQEIDVVIHGTADYLFPRLLADLERRNEPDPYPGLVYWRGNRLVDSGPAESPRNLDSIPFADFTKFPMEFYEDQNRIPIAASRGCVWFCRFCSTREFWPMYSYMSGERIYAEIMYHKRHFPRRHHVEFYDITANGKPETLGRLSDLIIENEARTGWKHFKWKINAIIRPEMNENLLEKMAKANCQDIIYGVESGSPRVLKLMNKHYKPEIAERVLRDTHQAGIKAIGNFMFGFPGETEEDFQMTLDFLRRNHQSFDRVYASATFTSLEENSYLTEHQRDFGVRIQKNKHHSLYWESKDGTNNYLVRLNRYTRFRQLAIELGIDAYKGVNGALGLDHTLNTAQYYIHTDHPFASLRHFNEYLEMDPASVPVNKQLNSLKFSLKSLQGAIEILRNINRSFPDAPETRRVLGREWKMLSHAPRKKRKRSGKSGQGRNGSAKWNGSLKQVKQAAFLVHKIDFYTAKIVFDRNHGFHILWGKDRLSDLAAAGETVGSLLKKQTPSPVAGTPAGMS